MPLYDFLYVDSDRLSSLQQQLGTSTLIETIEKLKDGGHVRNDWRPSGFGFVELNGDLFVASRGLIDFATSALSAPPPDDDFDESPFDGDPMDDDDGDEEEEDDEEDEDDEFDDDFDAQDLGPGNPVQALLRHVGVPSLFTLVGRHGDTAGGALDDEFLVGSVASVYVQSSPGAMQGVTVLGLAEPKVKELASPQGGIIEGAYPLLTTLYGGLLPEGTLRITPLAMYREIGGAPGKKR